MEKNRSSPEEQRSAESDVNAAVHSPLNDLIPSIPIEQVQSLVTNYWDRAADVGQRESREVLAQMFLEVITTLSNLILEAFRSIVVDGRVREHPLLVTEQAVEKAVQVSLTESFQAVLGESHQSVNTVCRGLIAEVTSNINSALNHSQVQNRRLVVPKETLYRPTKERMKDLVRHARQMLRSFRDRVGRGCGGCFTANTPCTPTETQEQVTEISLSESLQTASTIDTFTTKEMDTMEQRASSNNERLRSTPQTPEVMQQSTEEKAQPSSRCRKPTRTLRRCAPCICSEQQDSSDVAESEEEQPRADPLTPRLSRVSSSGGFMKTSSPASASKSLSLNSSLSVQEATAEAVKISGEEERSLSDESLRAVPLYIEPSQAPLERVVPIGRADKLPTPDVPKTPTSQKPVLWSRDDCNKLVYEIVSKIFQAELHPLSVRLSQDLLAQLEDQVTEWNVLVKPNRYKDVASAVYKELCKGKEKSHVQHAALAQWDFSSTVLEEIYCTLVVPLKKKHTLSTFLRWVCCV